jgi:hydrogenase-4 component B
MNGGILLLSAGLLLALGACLRRHTRAWISLTLAGCAFAAACAISVFTTGAWDWQGGFRVGGELAHLRMDALSAFFLMLLSALGAAGALYSVQYWSPKKHPCSSPAGRILWNTVLTAMGIVLCCANGLHFLISWEIFTVTAYFLITVERRKIEIRKAGWLYLAASHAGTLCLFGFFAFLAAKTGSWNLGPMHDHPELAPVFWLALAGFGVKAGLFPLHIWLPSAHANAPSHVSAILSGVAIKMGIYGIVRFSGWLPLPPGAGWVVLGLGAVSSVLGVAFALAQHDLKRLLAYHSVENIGIILLGVGLAILGRQVGGTQWGALALAGGLLHVWNHGVFKGLLFLERGLGSARYGHPPHEQPRGAMARHAVDRQPVRTGRRGDLRAAAFERVRQ